MNIDVNSRKEQRKFGMVMAVAVAVLGMIRWWHTGSLPVILLGVASVFLLFGVLLPPALRPVLVVWIKFALALNWLMTRLLLGLAFFLLITPMRLLVRVFAADPLKRTWEPEAESYWEEAEEQPGEFERYLNQY